MPPKDTTRTQPVGDKPVTTPPTGGPPAGTPPAGAPPVNSPAAAAAAAAEGGAVKVTQQAAMAPIVERVQTTDSPTGEPTSAEIRPEQPQSAVFRNALARDAFGRPAAAAIAEARRATYAGTLPAKTRVLAGGERIALSARESDTQTREFTATIRILKSKALYEPGAPVPLTRSDFEAKRRSGAILERSFEDGRSAEETARPE